MRTARAALLITSLLTFAVLMAGCTLPGSEEPLDLGDVASPTPQEDEAPTPDVIEVTPLGEEPAGEVATPVETDIEAQELGEPDEEVAPEAEPVEEGDAAGEEAQATATLEPEPTVEEPADEPAGEVAAAGAILFVRDGQIYRMPQPGADAEPLTDLPDGAVIRDLTASPTGQAAAFTIDSTQVALLDLATGQVTILDESPPDVVRRVVWSPDGALLYYQKSTTNPENIPSAQAVGLWHMVYEVPADLSTEPAPITAVPETSNSEVALRFVLPGDRRMLLTEHQLGDDGLSRVLLFDRGLIPLTLEAFPTIGVLDLSPDGSRLLFVDQTAWVQSGADAPVPLYVATLDDQGALAGEQPVATDPGTAYRDAAFGPGGERIAALRASAPFDVSEGVDVVLFTPAVGGGYEAGVLTAQDGATHASLAWYGDGAILTQRVPAGGGEPELWLLPVEGSEGTSLGAGEQPVVVPQGAGE